MRDESEEQQIVQCDYMTICNMAYCPKETGINPCFLEKFFDRVEEMKEQYNVEEDETAHLINRKRIATLIGTIFERTRREKREYEKNPKANEICLDGKYHWLQKQLVDYAKGFCCDPLPQEISMQKMSPKDRAGIDPLCLDTNIQTTNRGVFTDMILSLLRDEHEEEPAYVRTTTRDEEQERRQTAELDWLT